MTSQVLTPNTEAAILTRILASDSRQLTPGAARYLLAIKLHISDEDRVNDLSAKARARGRSLRPRLRNWTGIFI